MARGKSVLSVLACIAAFVLLFSSCTPSYERAEGYAMGTAITVTAQSEKTARELLPLVSALENEISHKIPSSSVAALNRGESVSLSPALLSVIEMALALEGDTSGAFSVRLLPISSLWHFEDATVPDADALSSALAEIKESRLSLSGSTATLSGGGVDLGAVGKGMAADVLAEALKSKGESGVVAVGGSIGVVGDKNGTPWRIGVRDPFSDSQSDIVGTLLLKDTFVSTSGSYEKCFEKDGASYHHILDSKTGMPVKTDLVSVTVIAESGALSDALSTALFAVGVEAGTLLAREYGAEALFVKKDGTMLATRGFADVFSTEKGEVQILED